MPNREWSVYLAGEIHSDWRTQLEQAAQQQQLPLQFLTPVIDHAASDNCGVEIFGAEEKPLWRDYRGASLNAVRTRTLIQAADMVVVRFGDKYKQWNAAFDAGYAVALGKPLIVQHASEYTHALKEIDAAALAVAETLEQVVKALKYVTTGTL
jgi:YtoQ family protein